MTAAEKKRRDNLYWGRKIVELEHKAFRNGFWVGVILIAIIWIATSLIL